MTPRLEHRTGRPLPGGWRVSGRAGAESAGRPAFCTVCGGEEVNDGMSGVGIEVVIFGVLVHCQLAVSKIPRIALQCPWCGCA